MTAQNKGIRKKQANPRTILPKIWKMVRKSSLSGEIIIPELKRKDNPGLKQKRQKETR